MHPISLLYPFTHQIFPRLSSQLPFKRPFFISSHHLTQIVFTKPPEGFLSKKYIAAIFCNRDGKFLFLLRQPNKSHGNTWGIPGGKVNKDETPKEGAIREFFEETRIQLNEKEVKDVGHVYIKDPTYGDFIYWMFSTKYSSQNEVEINKEEHRQARWLTFKEALELKEPLIPGEKECIEFFEEL